MIVLVLGGTANAQETMYGSTDDGLFGIVNQTTGEFTTLGDPADGVGNEVLSGITFDARGRVFGTVPFGRRDTSLILIAPATGERVDIIGPIVDSGQNPLRITDLATQPITDVLFGVSSGGSLYTIDKNTALATVVGGVPGRGGLGFAPDGRLFLATVDSTLWQIDPTDGATIGDVVILSSCIDGLGFRPSDGAAFATECDGSRLFRLNVTTGNLEELPDTNEDTADIAFPLRSKAAAPALSPLALGVLAAAIAGLGIRRLR